MALRVFVGARQHVCDLRRRQAQLPRGVGRRTVGFQNFGRIVGVVAHDRARPAAPAVAVRPPRRALRHSRCERPRIVKFLDGLRRRFRLHKNFLRDDRAHRVVDDLRFPDRERRRDSAREAEPAKESEGAVVGVRQERLRAVFRFGALFDATHHQRPQARALPRAVHRDESEFHERHVAFPDAVTGARDDAAHDGGAAFERRRTLF
mmetsp:Transcript_12851/g.38770  ORF Transcript_12851/g.38770 Transcript_12851/m.38770 type:complete len:206 (+) Transcript_12851:1872-2489(+)